ncbi:MAG: hypothetical protein V4596_04010 [Bdellovibrionota bacterium]
MKMLNLVILVLAVTFFVACSKKKDGNSTPQPQLPYGTTPTDQMYGNGYYPNGPQPMPGYQLPSQANCQGPGQMFSDLRSYCGWLARDGERLCNPMVVRQNFIQYCQSFAMTFNYCVPEIRSNCYYKQGCAVQVKGTWERYSHASKRKRDSGSWTSQQGGQVIVGPINPVPPNDSEPEEQNDCKQNISVDCKKENPKKPKLICKLPDDSSSEENYVYDLEDYKALACKDSSSKVAVREAPKSTSTQSVAVIPKATTSQTTKAVDANTSTQDTVQSSGAMVPSADMGKCMDLEKMNKYILDSSNQVSTLSVFIEATLLSQNQSKNVVSQFNEIVKSDEMAYRGSISGKENNNTTGIGANIQQPVSGVSNSGNILIVNGVKGNIEECTDKRLTVRVSKPYGIEKVTYSWNGLLDNDFEMIVSRKGAFLVRGNDASSFTASRYIGLAKGEINNQAVSTKIMNDMQRKGYSLK